MTGWSRVARARTGEAAGSGASAEASGVDGELSPGRSLVLRWLALYTVNWIVYALAFWVFVLSFGRGGAMLEVAPAFAAAYVAGYLMIFAPAGVGVREGFLTVFLSPVFGHGSAAALAVLARLWTTSLEVVPAAGLWARHLYLGSAAGGPPR
jgi:uncharacterized membrane protein YbhN (UPF0104 family)